MFKKNKPFILLIYVLIFINPFYTFCQNDTLHKKKEKKVQQLDVFNLFMSKKAHEKLNESNLYAKKDKLYIAAFPFVGYNPALGFCVGFTFNPAIYFGDVKHTPISSFAINGCYTAKKQILLSIRSNIYTNNADIILKGDWRYYCYSQATYGLGSDISTKDTNVFHVSTGDLGYIVSNSNYMMKFNYIRIYESIYKKIKDKFYLGLGFNYDYYYDIVDYRLNLDTTPIQLTAHYDYCIRNNFSYTKYTLSGINISAMIDSRDNSIRPTKGVYFNSTFRFNPTFIGSSQNSTTLNIEFRTYLRLSKRNPAHLIAFWSLNNFQLLGRTPYLDLMSIGWDTYNRSGRGYVQGRIRGVNYMYGEVEYRFPISPYSRILSGVVFVNASTTDNDTKTIKLFNDIAPAAGAGLRIMLNRKSLSNLTIDFGFGKDGSKGLFLNVNETF